MRRKVRFIIKRPRSVYYIYYKRFVSYLKNLLFNLLQYGKLIINEIFKNFKRGAGLLSNYLKNVFHASLMHSDLVQHRVKYSSNYWIWLQIHNCYIIFLTILRIVISCVILILSGIILYLVIFYVYFALIPVKADAHLFTWFNPELIINKLLIIKPLVIRLFAIKQFAIINNFYIELITITNLAVIWVNPTLYNLHFYINVICAALIMLQLHSDLAMIIRHHHFLKISYNGPGLEKPITEEAFFYSARSGLSKLYITVIKVITRMFQSQVATVKVGWSIIYPAIICGLLLYIIIRCANYYGLYDFLDWAWTALKNKCLKRYNRWELRIYADIDGREIIVRVNFWVLPSYTGGPRLMKTVIIGWTWYYIRYAMYACIIPSYLKYTFLFSYVPQLLFLYKGLWDLIVRMGNERLGPSVKYKIWQYLELTWLDIRVQKVCHLLYIMYNGIVKQPWAYYIEIFNAALNKAIIISSQTKHILLHDINVKLSLFISETYSYYKGHGFLKTMAFILVCFLMFLFNSIWNILKYIKIFSIYLFKVLNIWSLQLNYIFLILKLKKPLNFIKGLYKANLSRLIGWVDTFQRSKSLNGKPVKRKGSIKQDQSKLREKLRYFIGYRKRWRNQPYNIHMLLFRIVPEFLNNIIYKQDTVPMLRLLDNLKSDLNRVLYIVQLGYLLNDSDKPVLLRYTITGILCYIFLAYPYYFYVIALFYILRYLLKYMFLLSDVFVIHVLMPTGVSSHFWYREVYLYNNNSLYQDLYIFMFKNPIISPSLFIHTILDEYKNKKFRAFVWSRIIKPIMYVLYMVCYIVTYPLRVLIVRPIIYIGFCAVAIPYELALLSIHLFYLKFMWNYIWDHCIVVNKIWYTFTKFLRNIRKLIKYFINLLISCLKLPLKIIFVIHVATSISLRWFIKGVYAVWSKILRVASIFYRMVIIFIKIIFIIYRVWVNILKMIIMMFKMINKLLLRILKMVNKINVILLKLIKIGIFNIFFRINQFTLYILRKTLRICKLI